MVRKRKNRGKPLSKDMQEMAKEWKAGLPGRDVKFIASPTQEKMSDILEEFIAPFEDAGLDDGAYRKLLMVAIVAWDAALATGAERRKRIDEFIAILAKDSSPGELAATRALIESMVLRKEKHFAANRRLILDFRLTRGKDGLNLSVISTMDT